MSSTKGIPQPLITRSRTTSQVVNFEHYWTVDNFSKCHLRDENYIESNRFGSTEKNGDYQFNLRLYPCGSLEKDQKYISLYLRFHTETKESPVVACQMALVNGFGWKLFRTDFSTNSRLKNGASRGWNRFIPRLALRSPFTCLVPKDKLIVYCKVSYVTDVQNLPFVPKSILGNEISVKEDQKEN